jgi:hypothetical protein
LPSPTCAINRRSLAVPLLDHATIARRLNTKIRLSPDEIESARWYSREPPSPENETFRLPRDPTPGGWMTGWRPADDQLPRTTSAPRVIVVCVRVNQDSVPESPSASTHQR